MRLGKEPRLDDQQRTLRPDAGRTSPAGAERYGTRSEAEVGELMAHIGARGEPRSPADSELLDRLDAASALVAMHSVKARPLWGGLEALAALVEPVGDVPQIEPALEHLSGEAVVQFNAIMLAFVDICQEAGSPPETMLAAHYPELADRWRAFSKVVE